MKISNDEVVKLSRKAAAHRATGSFSIQVSAPALESLLLELLLLRQREEDQTEKVVLRDLPMMDQVYDPEKTYPGTLRAMRR